jgi:hypothetical protein
MPLLLAVLFFASSSGFSSEPSEITPYFGRPGEWDCRTVTITPANAMGYMALPRDERTTQARVLYRVGKHAANITMLLLSEDAETLRGEVDAIVRGVRKRPIQIQSMTTPQGDCRVTRVTG